MKIDLDAALGRLLKERRLALHLTQADNGLRSGLTPRNIRKVEQRLACPTVNAFVKLALAVEISPTELMQKLLDS